MRAKYKNRKSCERDTEEVSDVSPRKKEINTREYRTRNVYPRSVKFVSRERTTVGRNRKFGKPRAAISRKCSNIAEFPRKIKHGRGTSSEFSFSSSSYLRGGEMWSNSSNFRFSGSCDFDSGAITTKYQDGCIRGEADGRE